MKPDAGAIDRENLDGGESNRRATIVSDQPEDSATPVLTGDAVDVASTAIAALASTHFAADLLPVIAALPPVAHLLYDQAVSRIVRFVTRTAERTNEPFGALVARCESPAKGQLLLRTIEAVREAGSESQLYLLAQSFVNGATAEQLDDVGFETLMARTIGSLEQASLRVLVKFMRSAHEIGLSPTPPTVPGTESQPMQTLNHRQLQMVLSIPDASIDALMATLEGQGLVRRLETGGNGFGGGLVLPAWIITPFGWELGSRVQMVAESFDLG